jgi:hypothetical protein
MNSSDPDGFAEPYRTEICWPVFLTGARSADLPD